VMSGEYRSVASCGLQMLGAIYDSNNLVKKGTYFLHLVIVLLLLL